MHTDVVQLKYIKKIISVQVRIVIKAKEGVEGVVMRKVNTNQGCWVAIIALFLDPGTLFLNTAIYSN